MTKHFEPPVLRLSSSLGLCADPTSTSQSQHSRARRGVDSLRGKSLRIKDVIDSGPRRTQGAISCKIEKKNHLLYPVGVELLILMFSVTDTYIITAVYLGFQYA